MSSFLIGKDKKGEAFYLKEEAIRTILELDQSLLSFDSTLLSFLQCGNSDTTFNIKIPIPSTNPTTKKTQNKTKTL